MTKQITKAAILFLLVTVFSAEKISAQTPDWTWAKNSTGGSAMNMGEEVCTDAQGNIYITGCFFSSTITFGTVTLTNNSINNANDIYVVKYDASGNVLWAKNYGGIYTEWGIDIACDAAGNVFVSGIYGDSSLDFGNGVIIANNYPQSNNYFVVKLNSSGIAQWAHTAHIDVSNENSALAVDNEGSVYVTGIIGPLTNKYGSAATDTLVYDNGNSNNSYLVKFDSAGNFKYVTRVAGYIIGSSGVGGPKSMAIDANKNIYICGSMTDVNDPNFEKEIYIAKYDKNGGIIWLKNFGGNKKDYGEGVAVDGSGNVYITGGFESSSISFDSYTLTNTGTGVSGDFNRFAAKLDNNGSVVWAKHLTNATGNNAYDITVDGSGNSFVCGYGVDTSIFGFGASYTDIFVVKLNSTGAAQWTLQAGDGFIGGMLDIARGIAVDANGNVFVTGSFAASHAQFGTVGIDVTSSGNIFLAKIANAGTQTGIYSANTDNDFYVYPNTFNGNAIVTAGAKSLGSSLTIYNVEGKIISQQKLYSEKNSISMNVADGMYIYEVTKDGNFLGSGKIIVR